MSTVLNGGTQRTASSSFATRFLVRAGTPGSSPLMFDFKPSLTSGTYFCARCKKSVQIVEALNFLSAMKRFIDDCPMGRKAGKGSLQQYAKTFLHWDRTEATSPARNPATRAGIFYGLRVMCVQLNRAMHDAMGVGGAPFLDLAAYGIHQFCKAEDASIASWDGRDIVKLDAPDRDAETDEDPHHVSKRLKLWAFREYNPDFVDRLWKRMKRTKYADATALSMCTGVRPHEIEKGVRIVRYRNWLIFQVEGAKTGLDGTKGQPLRWIAIEIRSIEAKHLAARVDEAGGEYVVRIKKASTFKDSMAHHSRMEWPSEKYVLTPYSFRHHLRDEVEGRLTPDDISKWMGHAHEDSKRLYGGGPVTGSWRNPVVAVEAQNLVRRRERNSSPRTAAKKGEKNVF